MRPFSQFQPFLLIGYGKIGLHFTDSQELLRNGGLLESALIVVGTGHRLADPEPLNAMLEAVEATNRRLGFRYERDFVFAGLRHRFYRVVKKEWEGVPWGGLKPFGLERPS